MDSICKHPGSRTRDYVKSFRVDSSGRFGCGSDDENRAPIIRLLQTSSTIRRLSRKFSMVTATQSMNLSDIHRVLSEWPVSIERKGNLINNFGKTSGLPNSCWAKICFWPIGEFRTQRSPARDHRYQHHCGHQNHRHHRNGRCTAMGLGQSASLRSQTLQMRKAPSIICGSLDGEVLRAKNSRLPMNRE